MLKVVAENLATNALRYAGPGAAFTLTVENDGGDAILIASDTGIGVSER